MKPENEKIKSPVYWLTKIQNELFRELTGYMKKNKLTQNDMAKKLEVSKGYINQVLNGNFNFTLKKLIELSLAMNKIPLIKFESINRKVYIKSGISVTESYKKSVNGKKRVA